MSYLFQDFTYQQVLTAAQMDQVEENILKHEHGVTTNCSPLTLYATLSENETVGGLWTFSDILKIGSGRNTYIDYADDPDNCTIFRSGSGVGDFSQEAGHLVIQARVSNTVYRDIIFAGGMTTAAPLMTITGEGNVGIGTLPTKRFHIRISGTEQILWDNSSYSLGKLETGSDVNRGKVTLYSADVLKTSISAEDTGTAPITVESTTVCTNLNADMVDGLHASNSTGGVPVSNGTVCTNLNADMVDGYHAGNSSGNIPVSNGTVNTNLNADMVDGVHTKIIDIGDWNMNYSAAGSATKSVAHGLSLSTIRNITVCIRKDDNALYVAHEFYGVPGIKADSTNIILSSGAYFDDTTYDATSFNRGWVTIWYV